MASAVIAKGSAVISINPQETEARLVFTPNPQGDGWDSAAINKLGADLMVGSFPDPKELETFLSKAARAKNQEPMEIFYARGVEPEEPESEKINWEALPVPGDLVSFQEETLGNAPEPEITCVKIEKIKHEKKVKKPGALPFMAGKEELEVSWEKKEIREKVDVDPTVREIKYADRDTKLGTITPAFPGRPGKSVFGRPIPPKPAGDSSCLLGKGIRREKNEIFALYSGFVRLGDNWADVVSLSKHSYKITTGIDGLTLFFNFEPGDTRFEQPTGEEVLTAALAKGASETSLVSASELDKAIAESIKTGEPVQAYALLRVQEAEAKVDINYDKTKAVLFLRKGVAGALPLEMKAISQAIKNSGVSGFDQEKLKTAIKAFMQGKELSMSYVLAEGTPSTRGRDRDVQVHIAPIAEDDAQPILTRLKERCSRDISSDIRFDPKAQLILSFVKKDASVASVCEGSEGEAGKDIFGNVIPGLPGNDPDLRLFQGLLLHGPYITASYDGLLLYQTAEKSFRGEVITYKDARIEVKISSDAMEAQGSFYREEGPGIPLTPENVKKVLTALGVTKGIYKEGLEKICAQAKNCGSVLDRLIAKGESPIAAGSSMHKWLVPINPSGASSNQAVSTQVKAGTPIVELSEPLVSGSPGYDVRGNEIPIDQGSALTLEHDDSIREVTAGKTKRLIAARSGELSFNGTKLNISVIKTIEGDVTEDLRFSGEIQISGNVRPGCKIMGGSHVTVDGLADSAFISAGGKAETKGGFKGCGKGILRARAGIASAFVERASVMAVGDVRLEKGSILSQIKTNGKLFITAENGKLSGGVCQARCGIDAADIGSEKGVRTELSFGQDYMLKDEIYACEEVIATHTKTLNETEEMIKDYIKRKLPISDELKQEKIKLLKLQEQFTLKIFNLREKFEEHSESEIRIRGTVFPGVVIESHSRYYVVKQKRSRVIFYFDRESGRIIEKPLS